MAKKIQDELLVLIDVKPENGEYYTPNVISGNYAFGYVKSVAAANRFILMFEELKKEEGNTKKLKEVFGSCKAWVTKEQLDKTKVEVKFSFKDIDKLIALNKMICKNNYILTKEDLKKVLDLEWTILNLWKYKSEDILTDAFKNMKDEPYIYDVLCSGTMSYISTCIYFLQNSLDMKERQLHKEYIIKSLRIIELYCNTKNFELQEDKENVKKIKAAIQEMLVAKFY
jgi:hypothetical protein